MQCSAYLYIAWCRLGCPSRCQQEPLGRVRRERIACAGVLLNPRGHNPLPLRDEVGTKKTKTDVLETLVRLPGRLAERPARVACPIAGEPRATQTVPCACWGILSSRSMGRVE